MQKLIVFQNISLDGYFVDAQGRMDWAKGGNDDEFNAFSSENAKGGGLLIFGRVTYELMAGFWPSQEAREALPVVAERMNSCPKLVFSRTMDKAPWNNTRLAKRDPGEEISDLKGRPGPGIAILGSGSLVAQLAPLGLIDEYKVVVNPVVLGAGRTMFQGIRETLDLSLVSSRTFRNGKVFLCYKPAL
jgi:dihydrofolate reductase